MLCCYYLSQSNLQAHPCPEFQCCLAIYRNPRIASFQRSEKIFKISDVQHWNLGSGGKMSKHFGWRNRKFFRIRSCGSAIRHFVDSRLFLPSMDSISSMLFGKIHTKHGIEKIVLDLCIIRLIVIIFVVAKIAPAQNALSVPHIIGGDANLVSFTWNLL